MMNGDLCEVLGSLLKDRDSPMYDLLPWNWMPELPVEIENEIARAKILILYYPDEYMEDLK